MTTANPRHICLISGGKDSTALALYMRDKRPDIEMEYVFCDTHKELEETYEYLARIEAYLGKDVIRLNSDLGERAFDHFLDMRKGILPSSSMRWCTEKLKIEPFEKYVGDDPVYLYVGIRADENREGYISTKPNITAIFPFREDGINYSDVQNILEDSGVGMPKYYDWRTRSGCYFCFFQRKIEWVGLAERHPELFERAKEYEEARDADTKNGYTWTDGESLDELIARKDEIIAEDAKRAEQRRKRKRPKTLAELYSGEVDPEEEVGCLICHL